MKKRIKIISLLLSVILILSIFMTACGSQTESQTGGAQPEAKTETEETSDTEQKEEPAKSAESDDTGVNKTGFPIVNESITLKILAPKAANEVPYEEMDVFKEYETMTNIHVEWDNPPVESFQERYNIVMASGTLPDIIIGTPGSDIMKYGQMGAFIPLDDLIKEWAPNLKALMEKYPDIRKWLAQGDGVIYHIARLNPYTEPEKLSARLNTPLQIRQDWLEKLNLEEPVTTDDWYNVWKAFKEQDPNGNGQPDEIPFSGNSIDVAISLVRAWGVEDGFYLPKDSNEVKYGPIEDKYREAIEWIAQIYKEGLIDKEIATNDEKAFQGKVAQNLVGSYRGLLGGHMRAFNETLPETIPGFKVIGTAPIKGPYGDQREPLGGIDQGAYTVITKDNQYPEASMRWLDYFYSEEGSTFLSFGPHEGETYYKGDDGRYHYTDFVHNNPDGKSAKEAVGTFSPVQSAWPSLFHYDTHLEFNPPYNVEALEKLVPAAVPALPNLGFSPEDDERRREIMADIDTFVDEQITKFILGQEPLSNWDNYVNTVKEMGIEEVLEIYQKAYDAWLNK